MVSKLECSDVFNPEKREESNQLENIIDEVLINFKGINKLGSGFISGVLRRYKESNEYREFIILLAKGMLPEYEKSIIIKIRNILEKKGVKIRYSDFGVWIKELEKEIPSTEERWGIGRGLPKED
ncbi:hypothetical protein CO115_02990 [Candidatus Falkowbacteria bacterium CG_4_9_14_3_um_filter_36_9]|uniref:Uncharacterized protein n=1 Tax=Candidatus Falkowbacteria bacterium CG02_land_8_20_14_3_00_36_14 TaxID=1974560 RepID=A0A2M7DLS9_9BACT|nr:MAG: hypothetical protein COS18_04190 [Candidatus Falkowbacteria bacterium CG02_land_8_20_14_3_00_36_14]PIX11013.1 MAG: hypothetical protein COZ73_03800 [Candidatus Falkowbacteria bacterium CG_4_8_14_3_um_filter_36_11]PJA11351.1 MAG: hypothetical protein COX67_00280 [Candidatus Falkowbacteria bacterium CG_4_10_14_0_2_um_filter_36_22]PJB19313.1 MAG: hypothetical protein CO115_02990 [Candidatus Falkowbacteria bacterium CG_4_9_14_3_um_filter_36_9]